MSHESTDPQSRIIAIAAEHDLIVAVWDPAKIVDDGPAALRSNASAMELSQLTFSLASESRLMLGNVVKSLVAIEAHLDKLTNHLNKNFVTMKPSVS